MSKVIVKSDVGYCRGARTCGLCEEYLPGFFSKDGGIRVTKDIVGAELAEQFCPVQCITIKKVEK